MRVLVLALAAQCALGLRNAPARRVSHPRSKDRACSTRGGGALKSFPDWYAGELEANPMRTRMVTSGTIGGGGDALAQVLGAAPFDVKRFAVFALLNAFYFAPILGPWFGFLARSADRVRSATDLPDWAVTAGQTAVDQTVGAVCVLSGFYVAHEVARWAVASVAGLSLLPLRPALTAGTGAIGKNLWTTLRANWKLWPAANYVNFLLVPVKYQLLFSNFVAFFWSAILSALAN